MQQNKNLRLYKIADASLKQLADDLKGSMERDFTDFETRGFTTAKMQAFEALITAFNETTTDEELRGEVTVAVENKDALAKQLRQQLSDIRNRAANAFGEGSGKYNSFGFGELSRLSDDTLCRTGKSVVRVATKLLAELTNEGLTTAILNNITNTLNNFDKAIDAVGEAEENRDLETQNRIEKGNALYTQMVKLGGTGKSLYEFTNEAKYNDYVLIETKANTKDPNEKEKENK